MKVYVITSGEYSSYEIQAVALDEKEARVKCAALNGDENRRYSQCRIEEYDTEDFKLPTDKTINLKFHIDVRVKSGEIIEFKGFVPTTEEVNMECYDYYGQAVECIAVLPADTTNEQAKKIMLDRIAEFKAKKAGI